MVQVPVENEAAGLEFKEQLSIQKATKVSQ